MGYSHGKAQQSRRKRMCAFTACVLPPTSRPRRAAEPFLWLQCGHFCAASGLPQTWKQLSKTGQTQRPPQIRPKTAQNPSLGQGCCSSPKSGTLRLTRANKWCFCMGCLWGNTTSRRQKMCAFTACGHFLRRCSP